MQLEVVPPVVPLKEKIKIEQESAGARRAAGGIAMGDQHTEDDDGNVDGAQHAEFVRLFEEAILSLGGGGQGGEDGGRRRRWGEC